MTARKISASACARLRSGRRCRREVLATPSRSHEQGGCAGDRRRQRRAVRGADGARGRRQRAAARGGAARMARRQFAAHAQSALHARRAAGRAGRRLSGGGVLAGPAEGHRRRHQRGAGAAGDPRIVALPRLDAPARRAFPAVAVGRAAHGAHQRLLHGRRQGAGQRLLPQRRGARRADPLRRAGRCARTGRRPLRRRAHRQRAHRGARLRGGQRRLRVEPRMVARGLGRNEAANGRPTIS